MKVRDLIKELQKMPQDVSVIVPKGYLAWDYINKISLGIFYPHSMDFVGDSNENDEANAVLIFREK